MCFINKWINGVELIKAWALLHAERFRFLLWVHLLTQMLSAEEVSFPVGRADKKKKKENWKKKLHNLKCF